MKSTSIDKGLLVGTSGSHFDAPINPGPAAGTDATQAPASVLPMPTSQVSTGNGKSFAPQSGTLTLKNVQ